MSPNKSHQTQTAPAALPSAPTSPARLLRLPAVLERTGLGKSSVYAGMAAGTFPTPVRIGAGARGRGVAWRESEIDAWINSLQTAEIRPVITKTRKAQ